MSAAAQTGTFLLAGDFAAARRSAAASLAEHPASATAHMNLALSLDGLGDIPEALRAYREAVRADPSGWQAYYVQGVRLAALGQVQEACWSLRNALTRGGHFEVAKALADALERSGRLNDAIDVAVRAVAMHPDSADAHHEMGRLLALASQWELAAMSFEECLRLAQGCLGAKWAKLGIAYYMLARYAEADMAFATSDRLEPGVLTKVEVDLWLDAQARM